MNYILDSNVFIQAKNLHYRFDFCPGFWDWIDKAHRAGVVYSIHAVKEELLEYRDEQDELVAWARERPTLFLEVDHTVRNALERVTRWVEQSNYSNFAKARFLNSADYDLVSYALARKYTVVSHEVSAPLSKKIKIPDVCTALEINYTSVFEMLSNERARFVLDQVRRIR